MKHHEWLRGVVFNEAARTIDQLPPGADRISLMFGLLLKRARLTNDEIVDLLETLTGQDGLSSVLAGGRPDDETHAALYDRAVVYLKRRRATRRKTDR
jgi:hypothetical protein